MLKEEYIEKMKELGWSDDFIKESIRLHDEAEKNGINIPYEINLVEAPINF
jgi:hypothetical protein